MNPSASRNLLEEFNINAAHVTEVRRLLQTLTRQDAGQGKKIYMMASAGRGEGKSTICALLAIISAKIFHRRTLVIDGDMRRPTLHYLLGLPQRPGLYDVLHRFQPLEIVTRPTPLSTLFAITSGRPANIGEAYIDDEFGALLEEVRPQYDVIFIDGPAHAAAHRSDSSQGLRHRSQQRGRRPTVLLRLPLLRIRAADTEADPHDRPFLGTVGGFLGRPARSRQGVGWRRHERLKKG